MVDKKLEREIAELRERYIYHLNHFDKKHPFEWEKKRKELHNRIFEIIGIERNSKEGKEFSKKFDKSIELELTNLNDVFAKRITNAESKDEMEAELKRAEFIKKWMIKASTTTEG